MSFVHSLSHTHTLGPIYESCLRCKPRYMKHQEWPLSMITVNKWITVNNTWILSQGLSTLYTAHGGARARLMHTTRTHAPGPILVPCTCRTATGEGRRQASTAIVFYAAPRHSARFHACSDSRESGVPGRDYITSSPSSSPFPRLTSQALVHPPKSIHSPHIFLMPHPPPPVAHPLWRALRARSA
jgi:hypothetical protein